MAAFLDDIAAALVTATLGQVTDSSADYFIYKGYIGESPDRAICLYETAGPPPDETFNAEYPGLQIRVRGKRDDYQAVNAKLKAITDFLHAGEASVSAAMVFLYATNSGMIPMGVDENRRPHLVKNFRCMRPTP